jgi:hypothetical protein
MYGRLKIWLHAFLNSALDGGELSASHPGRITPSERTPDNHWIGGWVSPRTSLKAVAKREKFLLCKESNPGRPFRSLVTALSKIHEIFFEKLIVTHLEGIPRVYGTRIFIN